MKHSYVCSGFQTYLINSEPLFDISSDKDNVIRSCHRNNKVAGHLLKVQHNIHIRRCSALWRIMVPDICVNIITYVVERGTTRDKLSSTPNIPAHSGRRVLKVEVSSTRCTSPN